MQERINQLKKWLSSKILGQETLVERLIIALLADGHLLVEGAPGLAKTKAIKTLSEGLDADFHRIQLRGRKRQYSNLPNIGEMVNFSYLPLIIRMF